MDSGNGARLERFGPHLLSRPEAEAVWRPALAEARWDASEARFMPSPEENGGHWSWKNGSPGRWKMQYNGVSFWVQAGNSRHLGVFPEQAAHWDWIVERIQAANRPLNVLNLFGYTGVASLAAARAGARVTHVDASPKAIAWARENQALSGLDDRPIRWLVDDALKFVRREARRSAAYDGIILDPPKFGRGPKGEVWEFYRVLPELLEACRAVLSPQASFLVLTAYAVKASSITLHTAVREMMNPMRGSVEAGELALVEKSAGRLLSTAIYARWSAASS